VPSHQARSGVDGSKARVGVPIPVVLRSHRPTRPIACSMLRCRRIDGRLLVLAKERIN
jgi:hypothetical protein